MAKNKSLTGHAQKSTGLFQSVASSVWNRHQHYQIKKELGKRLSKGKTQAKNGGKVENFDQIKIERKRKLRLVQYKVNLYSRL